MGKLVLIFGFGLFLSSSVGILSSLVIQPGKSLNVKSRVILGQMVSKSEMSGTEAKGNGHNPSLLKFFKDMVPPNIFKAFSQEKNLSILFFSVMLGLALGFVNSSSGDIALSVAEALYDAFQKLIGWVMYALPFGLCCLFASQISQVGINVFLALIKFVVLIYASSCLMLIIYSIIISLKKKVSIFQSFSALRETLIVALGTSSSFAAIPSALNCLTENLKIDKGTTNIVVPLGVSLNPHGSVLHFAISTVFVAQVYGASLGPQGLLITLVGSVFAGMAAPGVPGGGSLSMLAIIFGPLGLPLQAALVFFIAIDPIIDPILTVVTMHANCAATALSETNKK